MADVTEQSPLIPSEAIASSFYTEAAILLRYAVPSTITFLLEQSIHLATILSVGKLSFGHH